MKIRIVPQAYWKYPLFLVHAHACVCIRPVLLRSGTSGTFGFLSVLVSVEMAGSATSVCVKLFSVIFLQNPSQKRRGTLSYKCMLRRQIHLERGLFMKTIISA